jgi:hypothetical protein
VNVTELPDGLSKFSKDNAGPKCYQCKLYGHYAYQCPRKKINKVKKILGELYKPEQWLYFKNGYVSPQTVQPVLEALTVVDLISMRRLLKGKVPDLFITSLIESKITEEKIPVIKPLEKNPQHAELKEKSIEKVVKKLEKKEKIAKMKVRSDEKKEEMKRKVKDKKNDINNFVNQLTSVQEIKAKRTYDKLEMQEVTTNVGMKIKRDENGYAVKNVTGLQTTEVIKEPILIKKKALVRVPYEKEVVVGTNKIIPKTSDYYKDWEKDLKSLKEKGKEINIENLKQEKHIREDNELFIDYQVHQQEDAAEKLLRPIMQILDYNEGKEHDDRINVKLYKEKKIPLLNRTCDWIALASESLRALDFRANKDTGTPSVNQED